MAVVVRNQPCSKLTLCGMRLAIRAALGPAYCSVIASPTSPVACVRDSSIPCLTNLLVSMSLSSVISCCRSDESHSTTTCRTQGVWVKKDAARPKAERALGKLRKREAVSQRWVCRPARVEAADQLCIGCIVCTAGVTNPSERRTHSDQGVREAESQNAFQPL